MPKVNRNSHSPFPSQKTNEEHTCLPINHNSCLCLCFGFCFLFFLSYPFFPLPFTFFDKCHTPRVKCVFQHLPLSSRGKLSHFLGILWCSILPRICPYRRLAGVTAGKVSWQPLLGPVIVPERFFVARLLCRAMPARGCGGDSPELVQILFSFFFLPSSKPLIYAALGRFWFSDDSS